MNGRIKELAEQCHRPVMTADKRYLGETFDQEKFAELIINECISNISPNFIGEYPVGSGNDDRYDLAKADCVIQLKKHFGVE